MTYRLIWKSLSEHLRRSYIPAIRASEVMNVERKLQLHLISRGRMQSRTGNEGRVEIHFL
jgi:hypothetical protein